MNSPVLDPAIDSARGDACERGRFMRRDHLSKPGANLAQANPAARSPVYHYQTPSLDRDFDSPFRRPTSLAERVAKALHNQV